MSGEFAELSVARGLNFVNVARGLRSFDVDSSYHHTVAQLCLCCCGVAWFRVACALVEGLHLGR